jgi:hypothetical protein
MSPLQLKEKHMSPEETRCIALPCKGEEDDSWCGRDVHAEWHFTGADHALASLLQQQGIEICPQCLSKVRETLAKV